MAVNIGEALTLAIEARSRKLADNLSNNNALLMRLREKGMRKTVDGGTSILQEVMFDGNQTFTRFSGYEAVNITPSTVADAAQYDFKEAAVAITVSEREKRMNAGRAKMIDLLDTRVEAAEKTMTNHLSGDVYSDGTADAGKQVDGLGTLITASPATGTTGGISRASYEWWRNQTITGITATNIQDKLMEMWTKTCRGTDKVDLIVLGNTLYQNFWKSLSVNQRFSDGEEAMAGFKSLKFVTADVVLDGGVYQLGAGGSGAGDTVGYGINSDYLFWRPMRNSDMVPLSEVQSMNQAAFVRLIYFMGNLTASALFPHCRLSA